MTYFLLYLWHIFTLYAFQYGGELDSTGVWKLKWRAGALQPRKKAGKTQTPTLTTSTHWPLKAASSSLVGLWTGIRWKFSRLAFSGCLSLWEQKFSKLAWSDPAWVRKIRRKLKTQATHVDAWVECFRTRVRFPPPPPFKKRQSVFLSIVILQGDWSSFSSYL